jgi:hypothetical protein
MNGERDLNKERKTSLVDHTKVVWGYSFGDDVWSPFQGQILLFVNKKVKELYLRYVFSPSSS